MGTRAAASGNADAVKLRLPCRQRELELVAISGRQPAAHLVWGQMRARPALLALERRCPPAAGTERFAHTDVNGNFVKESPIIREERNKSFPV